MDQLPLGSIQKAVWDGNLPLQITLAPSESRTYDQTDPYLVRLLTSSSYPPYSPYPQTGKRQEAS
jgi:autophagy-related protein 5